MTDLDAVLVTPTTPLRIKMSDVLSVAPVRAVQRDAAVVTAVHVARDWAIEAHGNRVNTPYQVVQYMQTWLIRNGAKMYDCAPPEWYIADLVDAVWALAELPDQDPLNLVDDTYHGTSDEARAMLTAQYERDLTHALFRITWKD